jgi:uncharacterized membrane protein
LTPQLRELLFRIAVSLKGLDGVLEVVGGISLFVVTPSFIVRIIAALAQSELTEDPRDLLANYAMHFARHLSVGTEHFAAYYLLAHGVVKVFLVIALLKRKLWAYPIAATIFAAFIAYLLYRYILITHSFWLIVLSGFDAIVIYLIWTEFNALRQQNVSNF